MDDDVSERDIALATFREIRAVKWILLTFLAMALIVVVGTFIATYQTVSERPVSVVTVAR